MKTHSLIFLMLFLVASISLSGCSTSLSEKQAATLDQLKNKVSHTRIRVDKKLKENPESLLRDSLSVLDSVLEYTETVKTDPERFSPEEIKAYQLKLAIINENIERFSDLRLKADVSFPLGTYKLSSLSEYGRQKSDVLVGKLKDALIELTQKYPGHPIRLTLKTTGYTDETSIIPGGPLEKEMLAEIDVIESSPAKKRAQLNQMLSRFRADALHNYVLQNLQQHLPNNFEGLKIISKVSGQGETLPRGLQPEPPYQRKDERRRICIVSPFIEVVP